MDNDDEIPPFAELTPREGEYTPLSESEALQESVMEKQPVPTVEESIISCISGIYEGSEFPLQAGENILIGRDASICNIVYPESNREISRQHCSITFLPDASGYEIITMATYGLHIGKYLSRSGEKLKIKRGSVLSLDDNKNIFVLK